MRRPPAWLLGLASLALASCGDDPPPAAVCDTPASAPLPTEGALLGPDALPALECVAGGLGDLPGRWFVRDPDTTFTFSYPRYEGSCDVGFREPAAGSEDLDLSDGRMHQNWTDGTRLFTRTAFRFESGGQVVFEYTRAEVACLQADGTLGWAWAVVDSDGQRFSGAGTGTRFGLMDAASEGLELVGSSAGQGPPVMGLNVVVDAGTAYVVGTTGLHMFDVTDPSAPQHVMSVRGPNNDGFNDVRVVRGNDRVVAFAAPMNGDQTSVFDVTEPGTPRRLANIPEYSHSLQVQTVDDRTLLYLASYEAVVPVYDVTNPVQPIRLGAPTIPGPPAGVHDLTVDGDLLYLNYTGAGMVVMDVSGGFDGEGLELGRIPTSYSHASWVADVGGRRIVIHGDEGMTPDGGAFLRVLDGDPSSPTFLAELARWRTRPEVGIHNIMIQGTKAYIAYYQDGVRVVDLADPTQPREVAHYNTYDPATAPGGAFEGAAGVRVVDGLLYVADTEQGLLILRETGSP